MRFALLFAIPLLASAQYSNLAAVGISYNRGASPATAGTGLYARLAAGSTWAFTAYDALPSGSVVNTAMTAGVAQRVFSIGKIDVFMPLAAGLDYTGANTGWAATSGAMAVIPIAKTWRLLPTVRVVKSSVGTGYQVIAGVLIGWGW